MARAFGVAALLAAAVTAHAAVDRDRSQRFYEQALQHFNDEGFSAASIQLRNALQQDPSNLPARILLGETLLREDQPHAAIKELEMALSLGGDENLILVPLAQSFMETAQYERVITGVVPQGHEPAVDGELHLMQARAYGMLGNRKLAEESYLSAGVLLPVDPRPLLGRAQLALGKKKRDKADKLLQQAIALAPESYDVWLFKALAHRDLRQPGPALAAFERALELRPTSGRALAARAALWLDLGKVDEAKADLEKASDLDVDSLETIYLRTLILFREGKVAEARELLSESAGDIQEINEDVRGKLPNTELMLGVVAYFKESYENAVAHLESYLQRVPRHPGAQRYLAACYLGLNEWDLAIRVYRPSPNSPLPNDPIALSLLAEAYRLKGDHKSAERHYEAALEIAPTLAGLGIKLAMSRLDAGKSDKAIEELTWFVEKFPQLVEAHVELARVYVRLGRTQDAVDTIKAAIARFSDSAHVHNVAGAIYLAAENMELAREHIRLANSIDPGLILPRLNLARLERVEGNIASAEVQYRSLLEAHPFHVESGLELARILVDQGQIEEAQERIAVVLETKPDAFDAHALKLQLLVRQREEPDRIRSAVYGLVKKFESDPKAAYLAGQVLAALGDEADAKMQLRHAVQEAQFDTGILVAVAKQQVELRDHSGALWALTKALQGNPNDLAAAIAKVDVLIRLRDPDNAQILLDELVAKHGTIPPLHVASGDLRIAQGRNAEAIEHYAEAFATAPAPFTVRTYFRALLHDDQAAEAVAVMREWLREHPRDLSSKVIYADALLRLRRYREARDEYESLIKDGIDDVVLLNNLAMVYQELDDPRALETARTAHELAPDAWNVLDTYGWILIQRGEPEEGLALLREAYARSSTSPEVRYHIGVALMKLERNDAALKELEAALGEGRPFLGEDKARRLVNELRLRLADQTSMQ